MFQQRRKQLVSQRRRLYETYNSKQSIYFLMEPALGGELYSMYQKKGSLPRDTVGPVEGQVVSSWLLEVGLHVYGLYECLCFVWCLCMPLRCPVALFVSVCFSFFLACHCVCPCQTVM